MTVPSPPLSPRTGVPHGGAAWPPGRWQGGRAGWAGDHQERLRAPEALSHLPQGPSHLNLALHQGKTGFYLVL